MKVEVKISPTTIIVAEGDTQMEVFKQLAALTEVFGERVCGKCGGEYHYRVRPATSADGKKTYDYPELVCQNRECRAKLSFGQSEGGVLFPKRYKQEEGEKQGTIKYVVDPETGRKVVKGSWGWTQFNSETQTEE